MAEAFVVVAEFEVKPEARAAFLRAIEADARDSVAKEPGCRQFDVTVDSEDANRILLYEVYDNRTAFDHHMQTPHLATFRAASAPLVVGQRVRFFQRVVP